jgi:hypothetical protein
MHICSAQSFTSGVAFDWCPWRSAHSHILESLRQARVFVLLISVYDDTNECIQCGSAETNESLSLQDYCMIPNLLFLSISHE